MSDIVTRLWGNTGKYPGFENLNTEAAAEIERLRARVAELEADKAERDRWKAEAMAWRAWHDDTSDRGTGWLMELTTNVDKARAANDATRAANERGEG